MRIGRNTNAALTTTAFIVRYQADGDYVCPVFKNNTASTSTSTGQVVQTQAVLTVLTVTHSKGKATKVVPDEKRGLAWNTWKIRSPHLRSKG